MTSRAVAGALAMLLAGCASVPETHRYALSPARVAAPPFAAAVHRGEPPAAARLPAIAVEELDVNTAYDDPRMVYRPSAHRFEYYHYHHWSAPPALLVSDYLRDALAASGRFERVSRTVLPRTRAVLRGRLTAFEELDVSPSRWIGRVALELFLEDASNGAILWSRSFDESEPLDEQSPAGLARALSTALQRIAAQAVPAAAAAAARATRAHEPMPATSMNRKP